MKKVTFFFLVMALWTVSGNIMAQDRGIDPKYITDRFIDSTGRVVIEINVPGKPPDDFRMPEAIPTKAAVLLNNVPAFDWSFGCSATSAAMQAGYYDRTGYYNMYAGPTHGGLMPMDNSTWGSVVISGETRKQCPLSATRNTIDGRTIRGHVDDYWIKYGNGSPDPYITNGWTQHTWGECTGDYMGTNQSALGNSDGNTTFYYYENGAVCCNYSAPAGHKDGCKGLREFYESRGYTVLSNCTQQIYGFGGATQGFTFAQYKAEIDAGRPVLIQVEGHTMLGYGYDNTGSLVYLHDTWDYLSHTMTWGGSYSGMQHWGVTTIQLQAVTPNPCSNILSLGDGGSANASTYWGGGQGVWFTTTNNPCNFTTPGIEQIYSFVAPVTGTYSIGVTTATGYVDYLWKASSCSSSGWNCIDDIHAPGVYGSMYWTAGTTYYLLLDDEDSDEGAHTFYVFLNPCSNISSIGGTGAGNSQTYDGGGHGAWFTYSNTPCGYPCPGREKIYSFTPASTGIYNVVVTSSSSWVDYLWTSSACSSTGWICIDNVYSPGTYGSISMTAGTTYYILLDDEDILAGSHTFYLNLSTLPITWTGSVSHDWYDPANWSSGFVPNSTTNVTINTGYVNYPIISSGAADCNNLTLGNSAQLKIGAGQLTVSGNMDIFGDLIMDNASGVLAVYEDILWESGSAATISASVVIWIYGNWEFRSGANIQMENGYVDFAGSKNSYIRTYSPDCAFNNVGSYKSIGFELGLSALSNYDLTINGYLGIQPNASFGGYSNHSLILRGFFYNNNHFKFDYGTLVLDGSSQFIKPNTGDYINNLTISSSGATSIDNTFSTTLTVNGNLVIESGIFNPLNNTVSVGGDWNNLVGPSGFVEGTGKVIFNGGNYHQYCSSETFNILEVNKASGGAFRMDGTDVTCNAYDWTAGAVDVLSGSFTANDLLDNGIYGAFYNNEGGTINLTNSGDIQWVDLNGEIHLYGGTMNVYGNLSDWTYQNDALIEMTAGILDFHTCGIHLYNGGHILTEMISGGTIRAAYGFNGEIGDFTPTAGTFEFYGPSDVTLSQSNGCTLFNVIINKTAKDEVPEKPLSLKSTDRIDQTIGKGGKSNSGSLSSDFTVTHDLTIQNGILYGNSFILYVGRNWDNLVGPAGFVEGTSTVTFYGAGASDILSPETFYNLALNKTYSSYDALEVMQDIHVTNDLHIADGCFKFRNPANLYLTGNLNLDLDAGLNAGDGYGPQIFIGKDWNNANTSYDVYHGFNPGDYSVVTFNGTADQYLSTAAAQENFYSLIVDKATGNLSPNDNIQCNGNILINNGTWKDNLSGLTHSVYRNFTVAATGCLNTTFTENTFQFLGSQSSILTYSGSSGYFRNLLINKSPGISVTQIGNTSCQFSGNFTVQQGIYNLNSYQLSVFGNSTINNSALLMLPPASLFIMSNNKTLSVNNGGILQANGTDGDPVTIRANTPTAWFNFNVNSGGTISSDYCLFKNMTTNGVNVQPGAIVDASHSFNGCTFQDGAANGALLTINNNQTLTVFDAIFPTNTWSGASNVAKTVNSGQVNFVNYSGGFSGEDYDADIYNLINWIPATNTVTGVVPSNTSNCYDASNTVTVAGPGSTFLVESGGSATVIAGVRILFQYGTRVEPGGYMHGYITITNDYCGSLGYSMVSAPTGTKEQPVIATNNRFNVYPNPSTGKFTITLKEGLPDEKIHLELFNLQGERLFFTDSFNGNQQTLDLSGMNPGIYILKLVSGGDLETYKLVKTN